MLERTTIENFDKFYSLIIKNQYILWLLMIFFSYIVYNRKKFFLNLVLCIELTSPTQLAVYTKFS